MDLDSVSSTAHDNWMHTIGSWHNWGTRTSRRRVQNNDTIPNYVKNTVFLSKTIGSFGP